MTRVTNHAARRTKERLGLPKKLSHKNAENALRYGIRHSDTSGSLNRYISALYWKHETANNVRIYCNNVYMANYPKRNSEGYYDPTAYEGVKSIVREENALDGRVSDLVRVLKFIIRNCGFELVSRIEIKDVKTGRVFK